MAHEHLAQVQREGRDPLVRLAVLVFQQADIGLAEQPIGAVLLGRRLPDGPAAALSVHAGVLAGVVQVLGLLRWPFAVPALADAADPRAAETIFAALHGYLGTGVGETLGYLLTAAWTLLVLIALPRVPLWFGALGALSALAVAAGVVGADLVNFAGYVAWSVWAVCLAVREGGRRDSVGALT
ncbi:DUF4386 family protein [Nonomuraea sp. NPDC049141]|uniref:DUF4386 family protein n=1 Tax=Nonomuraea sp. NPDC049141 TaxID=3155500 RepID=UPI0033D95E7E